MNQERWQKIQEIFDLVLASEPAIRDMTLREACAGDEDLEKEVRELLSADADGEGFWGEFSLPGVNRQVRKQSLQTDFGPYQILEKIGEGGMGVVYKALDTRLQRVVALKCLSHQLHLDDRGRQRFLSEARAASRLDHPNICLIYDIGETPDQQMYFTMPCYEGKTLKGIIAGGPLAVHDAVSYLLQVCDGLHIAHQGAIFHRDIKPDNVFITLDGAVKILDFGVAKISGVEITGSGATIGTVAYMSPEQLRGDKVDQRTDIWSLGVMFYEMVLGRRPFKGNAAYEIIYQVMNEQPDRLSDLNSQIPRLVDDIVARCLNHSLEHRYADVASLRADLMQLQQVLANISPEMVTMEAPAVPFPTTRAGGSQSSQMSSSSLDPVTISSITHELTKHIGPLASVLVNKAVKSIDSIDALCDHLAAHIPSAPEKRQFLRKLKGGILDSTDSSNSSEAGSVPGAPISIPPDQLSAIEKQLTFYIGPIARTLVRNKSRYAQSLESLCHNLADHLDDDKERKAFLDHFQSLW